MMLSCLEVVVAAWGLCFTILYVFTRGLAVCQIAFPKCVARWPYLCCFALVCRVGEAANPGPNPNFVLGTFNPTGLPGKAPFIVSQLTQGDIWAVSETHLCSQSMATFRASMHFASSPYRYCIGGHPVPAQSNRSLHAAWRGVATISRHPTRALPVVLPPGLYESARVQITTTLVNDVWVTGSTVYGGPDSGSYPQYRFHNEQLLHHAAGYVCHLARGPRYVAGDWNVDQHSLPAFDLLDAAGFVDLQDLAWARWGIPIQPTCKQTTRKDFCYVSPELQALLVDVQVQQDVFPDHAVVFGVFQGLRETVPKFIWPSPQPFPWPHSWDVSPEIWRQTPGSCDAKYQAVWQHIEHSANRALPYVVPRRVKGRAMTSGTKRIVEGKVSPPKRARNGEIQPQYVSASFRHAQWLRQVRRLQTYVRFVATHAPASEHACAVWGAIGRSTGFTPHFSGWWETSQFRVHGAPSSFPWVPPDHDCAVAIYESFVLAFRAFEAELCKASRLYARQKRATNPNAIFQDLRVFQSNGVDVLAKPITAEITELRHDDMSVVLARSLVFDPALPVLCDGHVVPLIHAEDDVVWVENFDHVAVGRSLLQVKAKGTTPELFQLFLGAWSCGDDTGMFHLTDGRLSLPLPAVFCLDGSSHGLSLMLRPFQLAFATRNVPPRQV